MTFKPGDKVKVKAAKFRTFAGSALAPGDIRTIEKTREAPLGQLVRLVETGGWWWWADRFDLVQSGDMAVIAGPGRSVGDALFDDATTMIEDAETGARKGQKKCRYDLLPARPLAEVAALYGAAVELGKYAPNNWRLGYDWSASYSALQRHVNRFWAGERSDPETGLHPLAHAAFHLLALMEFERTHPEKDDRKDKE